QEMVESVVEVDDSRMERYLGGEAIPLNELRECFIKAMNAGHVVPILFAAAKTEVGVADLLHILVEPPPSPETPHATSLGRGHGDAARGRGIRSEPPNSPATPTSPCSPTASRSPPTLTWASLPCSAFSRAKWIPTPSSSVAMRKNPTRPATFSRSRAATTPR